MNVSGVITRGQDFFLETERTLVRYFIENDFHDLHEILSDPLVMENTEPPYDEEKTHNFLQEFCISKKKALAVFHKQDKKVIGYALFSDSLEPDVYEIGWIFNKNYWRQGLAHESVNSIIHYAFTQRKAHKVFAEAIDDLKSVSLMKKLGMRCEGVQRQQVRDQNGIWRDLYFYGLLCTDIQHEDLKRQYIGTGERKKHDR